MRIALVFPPQWDPRQPPLCIPTLAGVLKSTGHDVRAWDMNLSLYRSILLEQSHSEKDERWIKRYLNPRTLSDYRRFGKSVDKVEDLISDGLDCSNGNELRWDAFGTGLSEDKSQNWRRAIEKPNDFPFYGRIQPIIAEVIKWKPDLLCISINSDTQIFGGLSVASGIRTELPQARIVLGGQALRSRRSLLVEHDWLFETIDAICVSHGEPTLEALAHNASLEEVPNILWYDGKTVRIPEKCEPVCFSTAYEPDFSVVELDKYLSPRTVIPVETARGCPWSRCSFCGHPGIECESEDGYIKRPLSSVLGEIENHMSKGYSRFFYVDEAIPCERLEALSKGLARVKNHLSWICYIRSEGKFDVSVFRLARQSGCLKFFIGLETGSARLLQLHRKGATPEITRNIMLEANKAGIAIHLFLIAEFPDETEVDRKATDEFLKDVLPSMDAFGFSYDVFQLKAEIGTPLYEQPKMFGAAGIDKSRNRDMQYEFPLLRKNVEGFQRHSRAEKRIERVIEQCLDSQKGLRNIESINDSTHLLLIEGQR